MKCISRWQRRPEAYGFKYHSKTVYHKTSIEKDYLHLPKN
jgi:hypothetical protein